MIGTDYDVAAEVRKLAQRSSNAAKKIKSLITDSVGKIEGGGRLVEQAGKTLRDIVISVKKVSDIVAEMTAATREQATGIVQGNQPILQMDQVNQQNAVLVAQTAAASQSMSEQATHLQTLIEFLQTPVAHPCSESFSTPARNGPHNPWPSLPRPRLLKLLLNSIQPLGLFHSVHTQRGWLVSRPPPRLPSPPIGKSSDHPNDIAPTTCSMCRWAGCRFHIAASENPDHKTARMLGSNREAMK